MPSVKNVLFWTLAKESVRLTRDLQLVLSSFKSSLIPNCAEDLLLQPFFHACPYLVDRKDLPL